MASIVKNEKGFKVLNIDNNELRQAIGGRGICDCCLEKPKEGFYIAVLNRWFCPVCYHKWIRRADYYIEDKPIEEKNYQYMTKMLDKKITNK